MPSKYDQQQLDWLRDNYPRLSRKELAKEFNLHFDLNRPVTSIIACLKNHKIKSGRDGCFQKGATSWNKGVKGYMGSNRTSFKKGHLPHNHKPLWSERVGKDDYIAMSVPEKNPYTGFATRFKHKHVWLWEQEHGPVPKGFCVIFKDGDNRNFASDNFSLVSRAELLSMNLHGYKTTPAELKPTVAALAKLEAKAGFRIFPGRGRP